MIDRNQYKNLPTHKVIGMTKTDIEPMPEDNRPVILFAAIYAPTFSPKAMIKGMEENGFRVETYDWQKVKFNAGIEGLNDRIIVKAMEVQPDLIFLHLQNTETITVETAKGLQKIAPVINYTFDVRSDISWYKEIAPFITHTYFGCQEDVDECAKEGIANVGIMQSSADYDYYKKITPVANIPEILFIGANYSTTNMNFPLSNHRQEMIKFLQKEYPEPLFGDYGMGQTNNRFINIHEEFFLYNTAKIVIVQNQFDREHYQSDRIWRAMGSGAFVLAHKTKGIDKMFNVGEHLDVWSDFDELKSKIDYYLDNDDKRIGIAIAGYNYVRNTQRWQDRFESLKQYIHEWSVE